MRLGLPNKLASIAGPEEPEEEEGEGAGTEGAGAEGKEEGKEETDVGDQASEAKPAPEKEKEMELEDATDIALFSPYQWRDWSVVRSRDCLYLWSEFCAVELSNVSNGWFRFLVDNKLATMYSSGSTEGGPDSFGEL